MKNYLILLLLTLPGYCQKATITEIRNQENVFPKIIMESNPGVAGIINDTLRNTILDKPPGTPDDKILDLPQVGEGPASIDYLEYQILNNDRLLSLAISFEGCGAYCEGVSRYFIFDLKDARQFTVKDFFTQEGMKRLSDSISLLRKNLILKQLTDLRKEEKTDVAGMKDEYENYYPDAIEMYTKCLERKVLPEDMPDHDFAISPGKFHFYSWRCSAHFEKALDELGNYEYIAEMKDWIQYLTPLGRKLLN